MKNIIILLIFMFLISSCGSLKKLKTKDKSKSDSTSVVKTNTTTAETLTTTEKVDTSVVGKKDSLTSKSDLTKLQNGDTNKVNSGTIEIDTFFDKKENKIVTKVKTTPPPTHFFIDKKTVAIKNEHKTENKKTEVKKQELHESKQVEKESAGFKFGLGIAIPICLLFLLLILYIAYRKKIKNKFPLLSKFLP